MRIALIHATTVAIEPIQQAFAEHWPEVEVINILDDSLSVDRASQSIPSENLAKRIDDLALYAQQTGCNAIMYTCTAFGEMIEATAEALSIPVLKPNEAMFEDALKNGNNICMLYTFEPARSGMEKEFSAIAAKINPEAKLTSIYVEEAMELLNSGDEQGHNQRVAEKAALLSGYNGLILAQFSTARAAPLVRKKTSIDVLTSPETAVNKIRLLTQEKS